jgi:LPS-assembly protein
VLLWILPIVYAPFLSFKAQAQVSPPDRRFLFLEDRQREEKEEAKKLEIRRRREALKAQSSNVEGLPFDISAGTISYDSSANKVMAKENLLVGHSLGIIEAEEGEFDIKTNEVQLRKNIRIMEVATDIVASEATLNLKSGKLDVNNAEIYLEDGGYRLKADSIERSSEDHYVLDDAFLTTCECPRRETCDPWQLRGKRAEITKNGYGQIWDMTLDVEGVPIFYLPYLIFPAKTERQSGLLKPTLGYGRRSGYELQLPIFLVIDYSKDTTITPVIESNIRAGLMTEYRQVFSPSHSLEVGFTYLNESARGDDLLGTDVSDLYDPTFDTNRFSGYINHNSKFSIFDHSMQWVVDGNYVSDDLLLREFEHEKIGRSTARYVTSQATLRTSFLDRYSLNLSGEFNQSIVSNDDFVFQRAPEFLIQGLDVIRPFGDNSLGAKFVINSQLSSINFLRNESYQGVRTELYEKVKVPFHFRNIFDGALIGDVRASKYNLSRTEKIDSETFEVANTFKSTTDRVVPGLSFQIDTVLEKVYPVGRNNLLKNIADLGVLGRTQEVTRVKHTIEPYMKYRFVPFVDQTDNPQFDSRDRLAKRNVITYGLVQRLFSRHEPRDEYVYGIEEVTTESKSVISRKLTGYPSTDCSLNTSVQNNEASLSRRRGISS